MTKTKPLPDTSWEKYSHYLHDNRRNRMENVASHRTSYICLVLQDLHDPHNISACLRSADAFGIQNIHVVSQYNQFKVSSVAKGCQDWLNIYHHSSIEDCATMLKQQDFDLYAAVVDYKGLALSDIDVGKKKIALLFGNEHQGLSKDWNPFVNHFFTIPMVGFVESLNISVGAAITMQTLTEKSKRVLSPRDYFLSKEQKLSLLSYWLEKKYNFHKKKTS